MGRIIMKSVKNVIGGILIILNVIYVIMIMFLDWTVKKEFVLITLVLTTIYVIYRLYIDKDNNK